MAIMVTGVQPASQIVEFEFNAETCLKRTVSPVTSLPSFYRHFFKGEETHPCSEWEGSPHQHRCRHEPQQAAS